jgi:hypothetical protein
MMMMTLGVEVAWVETKDAAEKQLAKATRRSRFIFKVG